MNIEKYKENNRRMKIIITFIFIVVAIFGIGYFYKTFANFQVNKDFNIISGNVGNPGDVYLVYHVGDTVTNVFPSDLNRSICSNGVSLEWNQATYKLSMDYSNYSSDYSDKTRCDLYFKDYVAEPELATGMIPIYYDGTTMKVADTNNEWYNYKNHEWANAVLVNVSNSTIKDKYFNSDMTLKTTVVGQTVDMSEIQQMYVWIPRYRYQLWNVNNGSSDPQAINIVFEDKNTTKSAGTANGSWLTHPAFTFGSEELNGIWVGKFENSGDTSNITVKPNMASIANTNVSTMFNATRAVESSSLLGLNANQVDAHMMKDTEWGAVAYLYSSIYGTYIDSNICIDRGCEVWINNVSSDGTYTGTKYTGCAGQTVSANIVTGTTCESGRGWDGAGVNASTTGNMYGIYDMSGGNWEYTMSVMLQNDGTPQIQSSGFSSMPDSKYYNTYPYGTSSAEHSRGTIGTATKENLKTVGNGYGAWNGDRSAPVSSYGTWAVRGGAANYNTGAGVFAFGYHTGEAYAGMGFRSVLVNA